ncbi:WYL domain-containing protein [Lacihabitans sp. LS3-19]|uniref:hypothetical protein n=1 Tax=Lacihabitans sp. LS3-19 TaxID=2487335 RepID=UPI0020CCED4D|nr:hypothetical protein [Lacihabitans sp. LS3-19]MCP9767905.1 WYL domain-containing protein [Lacihabitans sp. LS3-19]
MVLKKKSSLKSRKNEPITWKKKWHHSQTNHLELEDSTSMTFSLRVIPNREFWAKVMEHVEDIGILEPEWMVKEFRERVSRVWEKLG